MNSTRPWVCSVVVVCSLIAARADASEAGALRNYRCNTHTHTSANPEGSDANGTPEFAAEWYKSHGYQCLFITDHDYLTDVSSVNRNLSSDGTFLALQGEEITQVIADAAWPDGVRQHHVVGLGVTRRIEAIGYPMPAKGVAPLEANRRNMAEIRSAGGLPQINHPNLAWSVSARDVPADAQPFLLEVWNAAPASNNLGGTDERGRSSPSPEGLWDELLTRGQLVWAVASDDAHEYVKFDDHRTSTPGKGWVVIRAPSLSAPAIMQALREGRFYASTGISLESYDVNRHFISLRISTRAQWTSLRKPSARFHTRFIGAGGKVLSEVDGAAAEYEIRGDEGYVRASIIDSDGMRAWLQPVFLARRKRGN